MYVCAYVHANRCVYTYASVFMYICVLVRICVCMYVYASVCIQKVYNVMYVRGGEQSCVGGCVCIEMVWEVRYR